MLHHDLVEHFFGLRATFICLLSERCIFLVSQGDCHLVSHEDTSIYKPELFYLVYHYITLIDPAT